MTLLLRQTIDGLRLRQTGLKKASQISLDLLRFFQTCLSGLGSSLVFLATHLILLRALRITAFILNWIPLLLITALVWETPVRADVQTFGQGRTQWTFFLYMKITPDLKAAAERDLQELKSKNHLPVRWVVFQDYQDGNSQQGASLSDSAETLRRFLRSATESIQSPHLALILWGHGSANRHWLDSPELNPIRLEWILEEWIWTQREGRKIDLLLWDSCWMQSMESVATLGRSVDMVTGFSGILPTDGLPYDALSEWITNSPPLSPWQLASALPHFLSPWISGVTITSVSTHELLHSFLPDLDALGQELLTLTQADPTFQDELISRLRRHRLIQQNQVDLGVLFSILEELRPGLRLWELRARLSQAVLGIRMDPALVEGRDPTYLLAWKGLLFWFPDSPESWQAPSPFLTDLFLRQRVPHWFQWIDQHFFH